MLRLLLTQLYDPDQEVSELAVQYLEEACESLDVLRIVVDMQPTLEHLGEVANALLYKFVLFHLVEGRKAHTSRG